MSRGALARMQELSQWHERVRPERVDEQSSRGRLVSFRRLFVVLACATVLVLACWSASRRHETPGHEDFLLQKGRLKHYVQLKERLLRSVVGKRDNIRAAMLVKSQILADLLGRSRNGDTRGEDDDDERWSSEAAAGIHEKARILNDVLERQIFDLDSPQNSKDSETADINSEIADVKHLASKQHVPLPPLVPDSKRVAGEGMLVARIEGEAVDILTGRTVSNVVVQLVGENDSLQPTEIEKESWLVCACEVGCDCVPTD